MDKSQRNFRLSIETEGDGIIVIKPPFTVEFDINRNNAPSANSAKLRVYNLSKNTRRKIAKDDWQFNTYRRVQFEAGYGSNLSTCFRGNARHIWSVREGVNYITSIEAFDGGDDLINGVFNDSIAAGTPNNNAIRTIIKNGLPNTTVGAISDFPGVIGGSANGRGATFSEHTVEILKGSKIVKGGNFFIDNENAFLLKDSDCIEGTLPTIKSNTGLLNTPVRSEQKLFLEILFEPRIRMCQIVNINSTASIGTTAAPGTLDNFNGKYKVVSIHHHGMISDSVSGQAITSLGLWFGPDGSTGLAVIPSG